jgi:hypothetical protein
MITISLYFFHTSGLVSRDLELTMGALELGNIILDAESAGANGRLTG